MVVCGSCNTMQVPALAEGGEFWKRRLAALPKLTKEEYDRIAAAQQRYMERQRRIVKASGRLAVRTHIVGVNADGTVVATGDNKYGQCEVSEWRDIVAVAVGERHTVCLHSDGTVVAAGRNVDGQCNVSDWTNIIAICAGEYHTVGLRSNGTVVATGYNEFCQCDVSAWRNIVAISAGEEHTLGLRSDGTVVATGKNKHCECDVWGWQNIISVCAVEGMSVGLKMDGTVRMLLSASLQYWPSFSSPAPSVLIAMI